MSFAFVLITDLHAPSNGDAGLAGTRRNETVCPGRDASRTVGKG
jgi:hypothetical protein